MSNAGLSAADIEKLSPQLLRILPAGVPPPGVQSNFDNPATLQPLLLGTSSSLLVIAVLTYSIRLYCKAFVLRTWRWDDTICTLGFVLTLLHMAAAITSCIHGTLCMHLWDVYLDRVISTYILYSSYIVVTTVTPALGLIKMTFLIQYFQFFRPLRWLRISVYIGGLVVIAFYSVVTILSFALVSPWPGETFLEALLSSHYLTFARLSVPTGVVGLATDIFILVLPIPAVLGLHTSKKKKAGILVIFMTGLLAVISSSLNLYYRVELELDGHRKINDPGYRAGYITIWSQIEMLAGIIAANMPSIQKILKQPAQWDSLSTNIRGSMRHLFGSNLRPRSSRSYNSLERQTLTVKTNDYRLDNLPTGHK